MSQIRWTKTVLILLVIFVNIGCDQVSKHIVRDSITPNAAIHLLSNHITVTNVENTGAFLSVGSSLPKMVKNILLTLLPFVAVLFSLLYVFTKQNLPVSMLVAFCFVIGGGIGNVFDRMVYGSVTDFLHLDFAIFKTGIFNMADLSIIAGFTMILIQSIVKRKFVSF